MSPAVERLVYLVAAVLFIMGLQRLQSPTTARGGNAISGVGMLIAIVATLLATEILTPMTIVAGMLVGSAVGYWMARTVKMTAMPQMVALLNGFGGVASLLVGGAEFLRSQGLAVTWSDARTALRADLRRPAGLRSSILSVTCNFEPDPELQRRFASSGEVIVTQGFIASDGEGNTVLLGRGGSDTSGAYFAAKLQAQRLEIWTDVPGMFSANPRSVPTARLLKALHYDAQAADASSVEQLFAVFDRDADAQDAA